MVMCTLSDIVCAVKAAQNILIVAHIQPDGDTLGSCFSLDIMIKKLGRRCAVYCDDGIPAKYADLFPEDNLLKSIPDNSYDLIIAADCADLSRLGKAQKAFRNSANNINIDHHITNDKYGKLNYISESSSVGEIIFELMNTAGVEQDELSAKYLYIAMATDTGNFTYSNTGSKCLLYASELVELFDIRETADLLFRRRSLVLTQLIGRALTRLELFKEGKIASVSLLESDMKEFNATGADCENIVDFAREIEETKIAVFFREIRKGVKISFRSKGDIDVGSVASSFGGGGHPNAAGCCVGGRFEEVKNNVIETLKEMV